MILLRGSSDNGNMVSTIVREYFNYVRDRDLTYEEVAELLRYSMCIALDLSSKGFNTKIESLGVECAKYMRNIVKNFDVVNKSEDFRQGILEACVHSMQMSINRARKGN